MNDIFSDNNVQNMYDFIIYTDNPDEYQSGVIAYMKGKDMSGANGSVKWMSGYQMAKSSQAASKLRNISLTLR